MYSNLKFSKILEKKKLPENWLVSKILSTNIAQPLQNHSGLQCCIMHLEVLDLKISVRKSKPSSFASVITNIRLNKIQFLTPTGEQKQIQ